MMHLYSNEIKASGKTIGFVPTMGYLHEGHLSLIDIARNKCDEVVVSIFVNPSQFSPNEDFTKYPRDIKRDSKLIEDRGASVLFSPSSEEIYPDYFQTWVEVEEVTKPLEGESRPTHFKGVTTVVSILFNIVKPNVAVFGQKDAQQAAVIQRMVKDLNYGIDIITAPIVREMDGLAMSSRNIYLNDTERKDALVLSRAISKAEEMIKNGETDSEKIIFIANEILRSPVTSSPDYFRIVNPITFKDASKINKGESYYILTACRIGKTRLIDNVLIEVK